VLYKQVELDLKMLAFMEGGKAENPEKNPRSKDENQQQTQPTYDTGTGNRTWANTGPTPGQGIEPGPNKNSPGDQTL